jgi:hypothetical protein
MLIDDNKQHGVPKRYNLVVAPQIDETLMKRKKPSSNVDSVMNIPKKVDF